MTQFNEINQTDLNGRKSDQNLPGSNLNSSADWSFATKELLDALPQRWTRGLLYF